MEQSEKIPKVKKSAKCRAMVGDFVSLFFQVWQQQQQQQWQDLPFSEVLYVSAGVEGARLLFIL